MKGSTVRQAAALMRLGRVVNEESLLLGKSDDEVLRFMRSRGPAARAERKPTGPRHAGIAPANYRLKPTVGGLGVMSRLVGRSPTAA